MTLPTERIQALLTPYLSIEPEAQSDYSPHSNAFALPESLLLKLSMFLDLLLRWNAATNLTAIRDPEQIVQRHFGESLFVAAHLRRVVPTGASILDFGSGAGFPGVPMQLLCPDLRVTLAESQGKKASFLREVDRALDLKCDVWAGRVQDLAAARLFDAVTLRAVDSWGNALMEAERRVAAGGVLALIAGEATPKGPGTAFAQVRRFQLPNSSKRWLELWTAHVPRGTSESVYPAA